jgi:hypothetical protein
MRAVCPEPSPADLQRFPGGVSEVSRFSCMKFLDVPLGLRLHQTEQELALSLLSMLPSAYVNLKSRLWKSALPVEMARLILQSDSLRNKFARRIKYCHFGQDYSSGIWTCATPFSRGYGCGACCQRNRSGRFEIKRSESRRSPRLPRPGFFGQSIGRGRA